ncbi:hypothetical protein [Natronomonas salsuginis]|uniref:Uncharacterized protein n=1 Tax=Natronomonas salsuginis TaxID=2217661 RepID=A0A4V5ZNP3_9EURY|nr:hypothetical protein [Natronomonas salsuginis]TKR25673.1 hypothetical protein DM868_09690 [Natronomonas salsuginis]
MVGEFERPPQGEFEREIRSFPEFFDRLELQGALDIWDAVNSETEIEGLVYHHRGIQVPSYEGRFVYEPTDGEYDTQAFSIEFGTVGPRSVWAVFDGSLSWDIYLLLYEEGAVVAWMSDAEFEAEEAGRFRSKAAAVEAGQFTFGTFFRFGPDWVEREEWGLRSTAPAMIQTGDGQLLTPETESEFYENAHAIPDEFRPAVETGAPPFYGLLDAGLSVGPE